ncbi:MAG TPA: GAF domain-containing protein [Longimicrobium sp.]|nr:GAF domain-containing protein [Longimicrobium sp.]
MTDRGDVLRDPARLAEVAALGLTAPEVDEVLQETVNEAAAALNLPTALVSVVMGEAQYFAAQHGLTGWMAEAHGTPVEWSFCANAVQSGDPFVVEDASAHPLTRENPLVHFENVRCYAGIPLVTSSGHTLGTLCVIGNEPRSFTEAELDLLRGLAKKAITRIEERRKDRPTATPG